jgi:putative Mg2+ transporter-C (MgtC) family protein
MDQLIEPALRIAAAVIAGAMVGANRDMYGKPSGVRVHALVALGAALVTMAGTSLALGESDASAVSRIIQGVIGGIGFLGAGVILRGGSDETRIYHLTTAASIWVTAALGVICGLGAWILLGVAVAAVMIVLIIGLRIDKLLHGRLGPEE